LKIAEWDRQDAKVAERKKRLREKPLNLCLEPFSSLSPLGDLCLLAVPFPVFLMGSSLGQIGRNVDRNPVLLESVRDLRQRLAHQVSQGNCLLLA
jgi:hypothetical protein